MLLSRCDGATGLFFLVAVVRFGDLSSSSAAQKGAKAAAGAEDCRLFSLNGSMRPAREGRGLRNGFVTSAAMFNRRNPQFRGGLKPETGLAAAELMFTAVGGVSAASHDLRSAPGESKPKERPQFTRIPVEDGVRLARYLASATPGKKLPRSAREPLMAMEKLSPAATITGADAPPASALHSRAYADFLAGEEFRREFDAVEALSDQEVRFTLQSLVGLRGEFVCTFQFMDDFHYLTGRDSESFPPPPRGTTDEHFQWLMDLLNQPSASFIRDRHIQIVHFAAYWHFCRGEKPLSALLEWTARQLEASPVSEFAASAWAQAVGLNCPAATSAVYPNSHTYAEPFSTVTTIGRANADLWSQDKFKVLVEKYVFPDVFAGWSSLTKS